jgi:hypothetical protein
MDSPSYCITGDAIGRKPAGASSVPLNCALSCPPAASLRFPLSQLSPTQQSRSAPQRIDRPIYDHDGKSCEHAEHPLSRSHSVAITTLQHHRDHLVGKTRHAYPRAHKCSTRAELPPIFPAPEITRADLRSTLQVCMILMVEDTS